MLKYVLAFTLLLPPALSISTSAEAESLGGLTSGVWARGDGNAKVRISPCGGSLCAVNVWIRNPGSEKVGDRLVMTVKPKSAGVFEGSAFDPQRNLRFSSRITISGNSMTTSGCVFGGIICRTASWTRE
jgi:uncharacterized protein (DUF2147 family)